MSRKRKRRVDEGRVWKFMGIAALIVFVVGYRRVQEEQPTMLALNVVK